MMSYNKDREILQSKQQTKSLQKKKSAQYIPIRNKNYHLQVQSHEQQRSKSKPHKSKSQERNHGFVSKNSEGALRSAGNSREARRVQIKEKASSGKKKYRSVSNSQSKSKSRSKSNSNSRSRSRSLKARGAHAQKKFQNKILQYIQKQIAEPNQKNEQFLDKHSNGKKKSKRNTSANQQHSKRGRTNTVVANEQFAGQHRYPAVEYLEEGLLDMEEQVNSRNTASSYVHKGQHRTIQDTTSSKKLHKSMKNLKKQRSGEIVASPIKKQRQSRKNVLMKMQMFEDVIDDSKNFKRSKSQGKPQARSGKTIQLKQGRNSRDHVPKKTPNVRLSKNQHPLAKRYFSPQEKDSGGPKTHSNSKSKSASQSKSAKTKSLPSNSKSRSRSNKERPVQPKSLATIPPVQEKAKPSATTQQKLMTKKDQQAQLEEILRKINIDFNKKKVKKEKMTAKQEIRPKEQNLVKEEHKQLQARNIEISVEDPDSPVKAPQSPHQKRMSKYSEERWVDVKPAESVIPSITASQNKGIPSRNQTSSNKLVSSGKDFTFFDSQTTKKDPKQLNLGLIRSNISSAQVSGRDHDEKEKQKLQNLYLDNIGLDASSTSSMIKRKMSQNNRVQPTSSGRAPVRSKKVSPERMPKLQGNLPDKQQQSEVRVKPFSKRESREMSLEEKIMNVARENGGQSYRSGRSAKSGIMAKLGEQANAGNLREDNEQFYMQLLNNFNQPPFSMVESHRSGNSNQVLGAKVAHETSAGAPRQEGAQGPLMFNQELMDSSIKQHLNFDEILDDSSQRKLVDFNPEKEIVDQQLKNVQTQQPEPQSVPAMFMPGEPTMNKESLRDPEEDNIFNQVQKLCRFGQEESQEESKDEADEEAQIIAGPRKRKSPLEATADRDRIVKQISQNTVVQHAVDGETNTHEEVEEETDEVSLKISQINLDKTIESRSVIQIDDDSLNKKKQAFNLNHPIISDPNGQNLPNGSGSGSMGPQSLISLKTHNSNTSKASGSSQVSKNTNPNRFPQKLQGVDQAKFSQTFNFNESGSKIDNNLGNLRELSDLQNLQTVQRPEEGFEQFENQDAGPTTLISHLNDPNNEAIIQDLSIQSSRKNNKIVPRLEENYSQEEQKKNAQGAATAENLLKYLDEKYKEKKQENNTSSYFDHSRASQQQSQRSGEKGLNSIVKDVKTSSHQSPEAQPYQQEALEARSQVPESENQIDHQDIELDLGDDADDLPIEITELRTAENVANDSVPLLAKDVSSDKLISAPQVREQNGLQSPTDSPSVATNIDIQNAQRQLSDELNRYLDDDISSECISSKFKKGDINSQLLTLTNNLEEIEEDQNAEKSKLDITNNEESEATPVDAAPQGPMLPEGAALVHDGQGVQQQEALNVEDKIIVQQNQMISEMNINSDLNSLNIDGDSSSDGMPAHMRLDQSSRLQGHLSSNSDLGIKNQEMALEGASPGEYLVEEEGQGRTRSQKKADQKYMNKFRKRQMEIQSKAMPSIERKYDENSTPVELDIQENSRHSSASQSKDMSIEASIESPRLATEHLVEEALAHKEPGQNVKISDILLQKVDDPIDPLEDKPDQICASILGDILNALEQNNYKSLGSTTSSKDNLDAFEITAGAIIRKQQKLQKFNEKMRPSQPIEIVDPSQIMFSKSKAAAKEEEKKEDSAEKPKDKAAVKSNQIKGEDVYKYLSNSINQQELKSQIKQVVEMKQRQNIENDLIRSDDYVNELLQHLMQFEVLGLEDADPEHDALLQELNGGINYLSVFLTNLTSPVKKNLLDELRQLAKQEPGSYAHFESVLDPLKHPILPIDMYLDVEKQRELEYQIAQTNNRGAYHTGTSGRTLKSGTTIGSESLLQESQHIFNKSVFDAMNESLTKFRPYGVIGEPLPWSIKYRRLQTEVDINSVDTERLFQMVKQEVYRWMSTQQGALTYRHQTIFQYIDLHIPLMPEIEQKIFKYKMHSDHNKIRSIKPSPSPQPADDSSAKKKEEEKEKPEPKKLQTPEELEKIQLDQIVAFKKALIEDSTVEIRQAKLATQLHQEIVEDEHLWLNYEFEETQIRVDLSDMIFEQVIQEAVEFLNTRAQKAEKWADIVTAEQDPKQNEDQEQKS